jgi:hypothetical protein
MPDVEGAGELEVVDVVVVVVVVVGIKDDGAVHCVQVRVVEVWDDMMIVWNQSAVTMAILGPHCIRGWVKAGTGLIGEILTVWTVHCAYRIRARLSTYIRARGCRIKGMPRVVTARGWVKGCRKQCKSRQHRLP